MNLPSFPNIGLFSAGINALNGCSSRAIRRTTVAMPSWGC